MAIQSAVKSLTSLAYGRFERATYDPCFLDAYTSGLYHLLLANIFEARHSALYDTYLETGAFQEVMLHLEQSRGNTLHLIYTSHYGYLLFSNSGELRPHSLP